MLPLPTSPEGPPHQYVRRFARHRCSRAMQVRLRKGNEELILKAAPLSAKVDLKLWSPEKFHSAVW